MSVFARTVHAVVPVIGLLGAAVAYAQQGTTYTTVAHFNDAGHFRHSTEGVSDAADGSLVIRNPPEVLPYLWVACSTRGTVVRIATGTADPITARSGVDPGDVLGEYWAVPDGCPDYCSPSRTAVDFDGSVPPGAMLSAENLDLIIDRPSGGGGYNYRYTGA